MKSYFKRRKKLISGLLAAALSLSLAAGASAPALAAPPQEEPGTIEADAPAEISAPAEASAPVETPPADASGQETVEPPSAPELSGPDGAVYTDVPVDAWYAEAVYYCLNNALMMGISEDALVFAPEAEMTRATLATVLYRIEDEPEISGNNPFRDVAPDAWYTAGVLWANDHKIMEGYGNGLFGVNDPVTRQEMATILWRYAGSPAPTGSGAGYADGEEIAAWAAPGAAWAQEHQIVYLQPPEYFAPLAHVQRCEIAWALMKFDDSREEPDPWEEFEAYFGYRPEKQAVAANGYISSNFQVQANEAETSYMTYQGGAYAVGVDVSSWQKNVDWQAVAASGVRFAMLRVGFRGYGSGAINRDAYFTQNIEGALAAGLEVGVYFFSQAVTIEEAVSEAEYTLKMIRDYNITYPVVFDWERQSADSSRTKYTSNDTVVACALAFCKTVEAAGYIPMFYASPSKAYKLDLGYLSEYPFWLAHYTAYQVPTSYKYHFDMWQYSSKWEVPGVAGECDVNICLTDWDQWRLTRGMPAVT